MSGYIDMHCHILPEVDDGAESIEETVQMLQIAYQEGIRCIIATPHHHPKRGKESPKVLRKKLRLVRREAEKIDKKFRVYLGTEVFFGQDIPEKLKAGTVLSMNKRACVLLEFSPMDSFSDIQQGIQTVQMAGYEVILAHAERYMCLLDKPSGIEYLWKMGTLIQINSSSITGGSGRKVKKFVRQLLAQQMVHCVGKMLLDRIQRAENAKGGRVCRTKIWKRIHEEDIFQQCKRAAEKKKENESE